MDHARLRTATFEEIWQEVVDPLYIEAARAPSMTPARPEPVLDFLALWLLYGVACRSGLGSLVAEEPPWMAARISSAARRLGHDDIAALWDRMSAGVDLAAQAGKTPADVCFADVGARDALEEKLVRGDLESWSRGCVRTPMAS